MIFSYFWRGHYFDKKYLKKSLKSNGLFISVGLVIVNVVLISISAIVFMKLENRNMREAAETRSKRYRDLIHWIKEYSEPGYKRHLDKGDWLELLALHKTRCFKDNNNFMKDSRFNFWSSFDYCSTIISTIGYGSLYPDQAVGKLVTIVYAMCGIPLMLCFVNVCCDALSATITLIIRLIIHTRNQVTRIIKVFVIITIFCAYIITLSVILNSASKTDSFIACLYFYVITLTTTGVGDISMTDGDALIMVRVFAVFLLGLTLVTTLINSIRDAAKKRADTARDWKTLNNLALGMMKRDNTNSNIQFEEPKLLSVITYARNHKSSGYSSDAER